MTRELARDSAAPDLSVVVPTYQEAANLPVLAAEVDGAVRRAGLTYELIVVDDDSPDGTAQVGHELGRTLPVKVVVRRGPRGLATAVVEGFRYARGAVMVVMDADLSHPAGAIPSMVAPLLEGDADFVVGSRYVAGSSVHQDWGIWRRVNAWLPRVLVRPLTPLRDPLSGFFGVRREDLPSLENLAPLGFKIGLEVAVRGSFQAFREVPIHFGPRRHGATKLALRTRLDFLRHLARSYSYALTTGRLGRRKRLWQGGY